MDLLIFPISGFPKGFQLTFLSALSGLLFLLIYGRLSNQGKLRNVKDRIYASFLEAVLFRNSGSIAIRAQGRMLYLSLAYFSLAIPPILVLMIPCILLLAQFNLRYASEAMVPNREFKLNVILKDRGALKDLNLQLGDSLEALSAPLREMRENKASWRLRAKSSGTEQIRLTLHNGEEWSMEVHTGQDVESIVSGQYASW